MNIIIPPGLHFADLDLARHPDTRDLRFLPAPLAEVCRCSGLDPAAVLADEDLSCWLLIQWYVIHRESSGAQHLVMEMFVEAANAAQESGIAALQGGRGNEH